MSRPLSLDSAELLQHDRFVRDLARSLLFDENRVDDVVQQAYLAALENPPRSLETLRGWLAKVVRNFAYRARREEHRRSRREEAVARDEAIPSAESVLEREATRRRVVEAALSLDEPLRVTVILRFFEGLPPREVARRLDLPVETVRSRLKRVREILRDRFDREHGGRGAWSLALVPLATLKPAELGVGGALGSIGAESGVWSLKAKLVAGFSTAVVAVASWWTVSWVCSRRVEEQVSPSGSRSVALGVASTSDATGVSFVEGRGERIPGSLAADEAPGASGAGGLLVRTVDADDGSPVPGVRVDLVPSNLPAVFLSMERVTTGADGTVRVDGLARGRWSVAAFHDPLLSEEGVVKPGEVGEVRLEVDSPLGVARGVVVDEQGLPVTDAELWLYDDLLDPETVRREGATDFAGRFELRSLYEGMYLGVRKDGFSPSRFERLESVEGQKGLPELRFVLGQPWGGLSIRVTDPDHRGVEGAGVLLGTELSERRMAKVEELAGFWVTTGDSGLATVKSLAPDFLPVAVHSPGFSTWCGWVRVLPGVVSELDVRLSRGVTIRGVVRDAGGNPISRAVVRVVESDFGVEKKAESSLNGEFELTGLSPGEIHVGVRARIEGRVFRTSGVFDATEGEQLLWDPELSERAQIEGVVRDSERRGTVARGFVSLFEKGETEPINFRRTGRDGTFVFPEVEEDREYLLLATVPGRRGGTDRLAMRDGVRPGRPWVLELPARSAATGTVLGIVEGEGRVSVASLSVIVTHALAADVGFGKVGADGAFEIGSLPEGEYRVSVQESDPNGFVPGLGVSLFEAGPKTLRAGEAWDLGRVRLEEPGRVEVQLSSSEGRDFSRVEVTFERRGSEDCIEEIVEMKGARGAAETIRPGSYRMRVIGPPFADYEREFVVGPGELVSLGVALRLGVRVSLCFSLREGEEPLSSFVEGTIRDGEASRGFEAFPEGPGGAWVCRTRLAPGAQEIEVRSETGKRMSTSVTVTPGAVFEHFELELPKGF